MDCVHFQSLPTCKLILKYQFKGIVLIVFILCVRISTDKCILQVDSIFY